jgi:hypothetical protein
MIAKETEPINPQSVEPLVSALIELAEAGKYPFDEHVHWLKDKSARKFENEFLRMGPWTINLKKRLFGFRLGGARNFFQYGGSFQEKNGKLIAVVEKMEGT